jgi:hypothetical protein
LGDETALREEEAENRVRMYEVFVVIIAAVSWQS